MNIAPHIGLIEIPGLPGIPIIAGTDISVEAVVSMLSMGLEPREIRRHYRTWSRELTDDKIAAAVAFSRDSYCSPEWLAKLLPVHDFDPCSNPRSHIRALKTFMLELGQNGLEEEWVGLGFVNSPFSNILAFAEKLACSPKVTCAAFLVNVDNSTRWWALLTGVLDAIFFFENRIQFDPPPGIKRTTNNKSQALIAHRRYFDFCDPKLFEMGSIWERSAA